MKHCWAKNYSIGVSEVLKYLPDAYDLFADAEGKAPNLMPLASADVYFSSAPNETGPFTTCAPTADLALYLRFRLSSVPIVPHRFSTD
jgi:hypothetical protein